MLLRLTDGHVAFIASGLAERKVRVARGVARELARRGLSYATVTEDQIDEAMRGHMEKR